MSLKDAMDALRACELLQGIDDGGLKLVAMAGQPLTFREGETMMRQGEPGDAAFVILRGSAEALRETEAGAAPLATLSEGDLIGEIALLCDGERTASVVARSELKALKLPRAIFLALLEDRPEVSLALSRMLARRLNETSRRLALAAAPG